VVAKPEKTAQRKTMLSSLLMLVHLVSSSSSSPHRLLKSAEALWGARGANLFVVPEQRDL